MGYLVNPGESMIMPTQTIKEFCKLQWHTQIAFIQTIIKGNIVGKNLQ